MSRSAQRGGRPFRRVLVLLLAVLTAGITLAAGLVLAPGAVAAPAPTVVPATATSATAQAVAAAQATDLRVAVAVLDTATGTATVAGEVTALFPSESVVKVLVAARLIADGQLTGEVEEQAAAMLTASDDDAASNLWGLVGGPDVVEWAAQRYGITGLGEAPSEWGWWGNTKITAQGLVQLYGAIAADPVVGPWIVAQLSAMTPTADDGTDQTFGLAAVDTGGTAAVKQGWGGDDDTQSTANLLSTGLFGDSRYATAIVVQDPDGGDSLDLAPVVDGLAAAVVTDVDAAVLAAQDAELGAESGAATHADDEVATPAAAPNSARMGGASGAGDGQAWWPASLAVLGGAAVLAALAAAVNAVWRRRATAQPW